MRLLVHANRGHMNWKMAELVKVQKGMATFFLNLPR